MSYDNIYDALSTHYSREGAWERTVVAGEPESMNLAEEALGRHADSDEIALRIRDFDTGDDERYTFSTLDARANRAANFLEEHLDRRERFGVMLEPSVELYATVFGGIKSQRLVIPLDTKFGTDAMSYRLADAGASTLVTSAEHARKLDPADVPSLERIVVVDSGDETVPGLDVIAYDDVESASDTYESIQLFPTEPYGIIYTSGTTGQPSPVELTHDIVAREERFVEFVADFSAEDTYFCTGSPAWAYGFGAGTVQPGLKGMNIGAYRGHFDLERCLETLERWTVTNAMIPPTVLRRLRSSDIDVDRYDIDLRVLVSSGESLGAETADWVETHLGTRPIDSYGASDVGLVCCNYAFPDWEIKPGSMGKPVPGDDVRLVEPGVDGEGEPADEDQLTFVDEPGVVGEIAKYVPDGTGPLEGTRTPGWRRTGDLGEFDEDGYWWHRGRADDVIISAGHRIGPDEVQDTLVNHPGVAEAGVVGVDHETRGEIVKAFVTVASGYEASDDLREEIIAYARKNLSKHEYPRELAFVDELPKTVSGKLLRRELRNRHESG